MENRGSSEDIRRATERKLIEGNNSIETIIDIPDSKQPNNIKMSGISNHDLRGSAIQLNSKKPGDFSEKEKEKFTEDATSEEEDSVFTRYIERTQKSVYGLWAKHGKLIKNIVFVVLLIAYSVYFFFAVYRSPSAAVVVIVLTALVLFSVLYRAIKRRYGDQVYNAVCVPASRFMRTRIWKYCKWVLYGLILLAIFLFLILDVGKDPRRVTSFGGMLVFLLFAFVTSTNPARVKWRPVVWGLGLQFTLGLIILRWSYGYIFFKFLGEQVKAFLDYTDEGSKFVFGEKTYLLHPMAFKVFPIVIYFSAVTSILYYWGLMQIVVCKIAWLMQFTMGTTAIESLNAATNIFLGMAESCVVLRPFINKLTRSELHAIMTGGFATVAGSYIALLVEVGASPEHLLSAAIMSAPAALAMAKLSWPETEVSHTKTEADVFMEKTPAQNVVEAASNGAIDAIKVVASVAANLIAIMGLISFLNATLSYLGAVVGYPELDFQLICSYLFWPVATVMGVEVVDAGRVASLLGTKVFVDEFISFRDLGVMVEKSQIMERSRVIATYACCGFGSIAAVGVYIGAMVAIAPHRRGDISAVAIRAVVNGNIASFLTACIAGILYDGNSFSLLPGSNNTTASIESLNITDIMYV